MAKVARRHATYDDLLKVPDHLVAELIDGELFTSPRPATRHIKPAKKLTGILDRAFEDGIDGPGGWWILPEPELHLGRDILVPDIAGWRRQHLPEVPDAAAITVAPNWICEVLSTSTARIDRLKKLPKYAANTVEHAWLLDPYMHVLEVYRIANETYALIDIFDDEQPLVRAEPFEAIEFRLDALWLPATAPDPRS